MTTIPCECNTCAYSEPKESISCPPDHNCCSTYAKAYGNIIKSITEISNDVSGEAFLRAGDDADKVKKVTLRIPALRFLGAEVSSIVGATFSNTCDIPEECCDGFATALENSLKGLFLYAANNIFILSIPLGEPSDKPNPVSSFKLGTVYANVRRAINEVTALVNRVKVITDSEH